MKKRGRPKKVTLVDCVRTVTVTLTQACTGCFESVEGHVPYQDGKPIYPYDEKARCYVGAGCSECGYTGKRRWTHFVPEELEREIIE